MPYLQQKGIQSRTTKNHFSAIKGVVAQVRKTERIDWLLRWVQCLLRNCLIPVTWTYIPCNLWMRNGTDECILLIKFKLVPVQWRTHCTIEHVSLLPQERQLYENVENRLKGRLTLHIMEDLETSLIIPVENIGCLEPYPSSYARTLANSCQIILMKGYERSYMF